MPVLKHQEAFETKGIEGFISPEGFRISWTNQQQNLINKLNELTVGTPEEEMSIQKLVLYSARRSEKAALFNHASMAHNNHFYFEGLRPDTPKLANGETTESLIPKELRSDINLCISSVETMREEIFTTAMAMFGSGFVWVVHESGSSGNLRILTTYNAGTPYPEAHSRLPVDMNTMDTKVPSGRYLTSKDHNRRMTEINNNVGSFGHYSKGHLEKKILGPGMDEMSHVVPILCVKVWEHAWLYDYSNGPRAKATYLKHWWNSIDWDTVYQRQQANSSAAQKMAKGTGGLGDVLRTRPSTHLI